MRIKNEQLRDFLLGSGLLNENDIQKNFTEAQKKKISLGDLLLQKKKMEKADLNNLYAYILGVPFLKLKKEKIPTKVLQIIPEAIAKKNNIIAFEKTKTALKVAMLDPGNIQILDFIRKKVSLDVIPHLTDEESIKTALKQYKKSLKAEFGDIIDEGAEKMTAELTDKKNKSGATKKDIKKLKEEAKDLPVVRIVDTLLKHAILQGASDIHIEPTEKEVIVRYRVDGVLHDTMTLPRQVLSGVVARIKVLSSLKLDEHRLPQDGRFKIEKEDYKISFRVNILPVFDGEKVVMRLLDESSKGLTLEKMGLQSRALEIIHRDIKRPNGMILVTGPTGSGKTTTLYTIMDILNTPTVNVSTVEDPVEYRMPRVNQTQISPKIGLTFAASLRALLRQDPDIIMVGEIRDKETMEIAMHAAMTGHLVLSTLHTNSAAASLPRLLDMGAEPFLVASTVNVIIAQRLLRRLCPECKEEYTLNKKEIKTLEDNLDIDNMLQILKKSEVLKGIVKNDDTWESIKFYRSKGCERCSEGYKGRAGIYEVMEISDNIKKMIMQVSDAKVIENKSRENGMLKMIEDGFIKAVQGLTSIEEVLRVTKE